MGSGADPGLIGDRVGAATPHEMPLGRISPNLSKPEFMRCRSRVGKADRRVLAAFQMQRLARGAER